jgi:Domain of unknown function (DUF397)
MSAPDLRRAEWRTSTYSANGSTCVEVARNVPGIVAVRDSNDQDGPSLVFSPAEWRAFAAGVKAGEFDMASPAR